MCRLKCSMYCNNRNVPACARGAAAAAAAAAAV